MRPGVFLSIRIMNLTIKTRFHELIRSSVWQTLFGVFLGISLRGQIPYSDTQKQPRHYFE